MPAVAVSLGLPPRLLGRLRDGSAYRDGGVLRETSSGRILALLRDEDLFGTEWERLLSRSIVPLAIQRAGLGAIEERLGRVEAELRELRVEVGDLRAQVEVVEVFALGTQLGRLQGALHTWNLEDAPGRRQRGMDYVREFVAAWAAFRYSAERIAGNPELLRRSAGLLRVTARAAFLAGTAARDALVELGRPDHARDMADVLARESVELSRRLGQTLGQPSALFWIEAEHRECGIEVEESAARLHSHASALRELPD